MERTTEIAGDKKTIQALTEQMHRITTMESLVNRYKLGNAGFGSQYVDKRNIYKALGYPETNDISFTEYWNRYQRQDIASAIIDRPVEKTWHGEIAIVEEGAQKTDSVLNKAWKDLNKNFKVKQYLTKIDKLAGIGHYAVLLLGFTDAQKPEDWKKPLGPNPKLAYISALAESKALVEKYETNSSNERYRLPLIYKVNLNDNDEDTVSIADNNLLVHHSRVLHIREPGLMGEIKGRPRLLPVLNRLYDLEKIMGGDGEMFWRNARPGYHVTNKQDFSIGASVKDNIQDQLDKFEHDLRRVILGAGIDIKALTAETTDPKNHIDIQIQAISAQTGIPKRILTGSERGELSSSQDQDQWNSLIQNRMEEFAEPEILRPFIDKMMEHGVLPKAGNYNIMWQDVGAISEKDRVEIGAKRAEALKKYNDGLLSRDVLPLEMVGELLLGLTEEQSDRLNEILQSEQIQDRDGSAGDDDLLERAGQNGNGTNEDL